MSAGAVLTAAQLKVRVALPAQLRAQAGRIQERFHLDAPGWYDAVDETEHLPAESARSPAALYDEIGTQPGSAGLAVEHQALDVEDSGRR